MPLLSRAFRTLLGATFLFLFSGFPAHAHTLPISYLRLVPDQDYLHLELMLNPFELTAFREMDSDQDGRLSPPELESANNVLTRAILDALAVHVGQKRVRAEVSGISADPDSHHITLRAHYHVDARHSGVQVDSALHTLTRGSHVTEVTFGKGASRQFARLDPQTRRCRFEPLEQRTQKAAASGPKGSPAKMLFLLLIGTGLLASLLFAIETRHAAGHPPVHRLNRI